MHSGDLGEICCWDEISLLDSNGKPSGDYIVISPMVSPGRPVGSNVFRLVNTDLDVATPLVTVDPCTVEWKMQDPVVFRVVENDDDYGKIWESGFVGNKTLLLVVGDAEFSHAHHTVTEKHGAESLSKGHKTFWDMRLSVVPMEISVFALFRNNEKYVEEYEAQWERAELFYPNIQFTYNVFENDSTDGTILKLGDFARGRKCSVFSKTIGSESYGNVRSVERTVRLSTFRNAGIYASDESLGSSQWSVLCDTDMFWDPSAIGDMYETALENPDAVMITCYGTDMKFRVTNHYYDTYAFKGPHGEHSHHGCLFGRCTRCTRNASLELPGGVLRVQSAFGGFVMIRSDVLQKCRWSVSMDSSGGCEHWNFCSNVRQYGKILLDANIRVFWKANDLVQEWWETAKPQPNALLGMVSSLGPQKSKQIMHTIYNQLLGRKCDFHGMRAYSEKTTTKQGIKQAITCILGCQERRTFVRNHVEGVMSMRGHRTGDEQIMGAIVTLACKDPRVPHEMDASVYVISVMGPECGDAYFDPKKAQTITEEYTTKYPNTNLTPNFWNVADGPKTTFDRMCVSRENRRRILEHMEEFNRGDASLLETIETEILAFYFSGGVK
jgi:GT2 family glycosyltransferase